MTREGRIVGTLEYLAPERIQGKPPDARADLYAMGIVLYELLTARLPFSATSEYEIMQAQLTKRPATPREMGIGLPAQVEQAVLQALEKDPEKRFADASTFAAALRRLAAAVPVAAPAAPNEPWWQSRQTLQIAWAAALALLLLTAGVLVWSRLRPSPVQEAWKQPPPQVVDQPSGPVVNPAPAPAPLNIDTTPIPVTPQPAEPTPTPVLRPPQTNPVRPVAQVPKVQPAGLTADQRRVVLEALDRTDGPVNGPPGMRPIHLTGLVSALKVGGPPSLAELTESVKRRGVNFPLTPAAASSLRESGADAVLIGAVESGYRPTVAAAPPVATPAPSPKPAAPEPAPKAASRTIQSIRDVKELYVEKLPSELDDYIRAEIEIRLSGRIKLAPSADKADAIMQVSITEPETGKIKRAGRILGIRDKNRAQARIVDRVTHVVLWEETAGDRSLMTGSLIGDGVKRVAARIVKALQDDLRR
jgi:hypothetical protein